MSQCDGLPDETGIEIAQKLKGDIKTKTVPIILLTAGTFDVEEKRKHGIFANVLLRKPIDFPLLRKTVLNLINPV